MLGDSGEIVGRWWEMVGNGGRYEMCGYASRY